MAGIFGALVGVVGASVPAYMQVTATQAQSRSEFLREKRMEIYSEFIASFKEFHRLIYQNGLPALRDGAILGQAPFQEPYDRLENALAAVRIVGTEPTVAAAERLASHTKDAVMAWAIADLARLNTLLPLIDETETELTRLIREEVETLD